MGRSTGHVSAAARYLSEETLTDGSKVTIRAMQPGDKPRLIKAFSKLSPDTVRLRFFYFKKELSEKDLKWLEKMDYARDMGLVATASSGLDEDILAEGRYVAQGETAEVAFMVGESWQGRGLGSRLLRHLARIARDHAVVQFEADVIKENAPMLQVFRQSGFPMAIRDNGAELHVTLGLASGRM